MKTIGKISIPENNQLQLKTCFVRNEALNSCTDELGAVGDDPAKFRGGKLNVSDEFFAGSAGEFIEGACTSSGPAGW